MLSLAMAKRVETSRGVFPFDHSDASPEAIDDDITNRLDIPFNRINSFEIMDDSDFAPTGIHDSHPHALRSATVGVSDAFYKFWPDHANHELIGQAESAAGIVLHCVTCDLELHIPNEKFFDWLATHCSA